MCPRTKRAPSQTSKNKMIPLPSIMACENMIVKAIDDLKDYIRRGSSLYSILKYIRAVFIPFDDSHYDDNLPHHLEKIIALSLKSLVLQGRLSFYPRGSPTWNGGGWYRLSKTLKGKRLLSVTRYHMHETTCRKGLFHDQGHVHPLKDRTFYINTGKAPKRKVLITKCKLSNSKLLSVTHSFLFKDQYMDLDNGYKKKRRHGMRRQSSSLIKTQLLLRKKFHIY